MKRQKKITIGEMRQSGVTGVLAYCADDHCSHVVAVSAEEWPDDVRLSDLEGRFTCSVCGHRGADIRLRPPARSSAGPARSAPRLIARRAAV
jgi:hypothetical protein